jgi:hypothetical protein
MLSIPVIPNRTCADQSQEYDSKRVEQKVERLVMKAYSHGMPYEEIKALGPSALPSLRKSLHDPTLSEYRANVCSAIGFIGAPEGFPILREFVWSHSGEQSEQTCTAVLVAQSSIGLIAKESEAALHYLQRGAFPAYWDSLPWACADDPSFDQDLSAMSIIGLTYTEQPAARALLVSMSKSSSSPAFADMATRAVERFDEISRVGFAEVRKRGWDRLRRPSK